MNKETSISEKVNDVICSTLTIDSISFKDDLIELGLLDSLALVQLMVEIEQTFNIRMEPENFDFDDYRSVKSISEMVIRSLLTTPQPVSQLQ
ncbi:MAG: phosphopantetheine-binding protein [Balneolales bacterium]|nr:phosphopantetheine-binding protein [Balneolales bacterium]